MTNFERWRNYMEWCISPDCYINFGYWSLVSAYLQRRVWAGPNHSPLFPNMYVVLVGEPGVGKGIVIKEHAKLIKHHLLKDPRERKDSSILSDMDKKIAATMQNEEFKEVQALENPEGAKNRYYEKPLLIPVTADATTYQALLLEMARSKRLINYPKYNHELQRNELGIYTHCSMAACLEEMSSLFRKEVADLVRFLLQAYDCGDYTYVSIGRGKDRIRNCCLSIMAGTTPGFMQESLSDSIISEGFSSRTFFIFASKNRKVSLRWSELTKEQEAHKVDILAHLLKISELYGQVKYTDEAWEFLENWWQEAQHKRPNISMLLNPYYSRKNIHVQKLAMAIHFGESTDMTIGVETFKYALEILAVEEKKMHYCLGFDKTNPLAIVTRKVEKFICSSTTAFTFKELLSEFWSSLPGKDSREDLQMVLQHLEFTGAVMSETRTNPRTQEMSMYYFGRKQSSI